MSPKCQFLKLWRRTLIRLKFESIANGLQPGREEFQGDRTQDDLKIPCLVWGKLEQTGRHSK